MKKYEPAHANPAAAISDRPAVTHRFVDGKARGGAVRRSLLKEPHWKSRYPGETAAALDRAFLAAFGGPPETAAWLEPFFSELEHGRRAWFIEESDGNEPTPEGRLELAQAAISATRDRLGCTPFVCPLIPRWVTVNLTAFLLQKFSFGRGGGPQRPLAPATLRELLVTPAKLARYLRKEKIRARFFTRELDELDRNIAAEDAPTEK